MGIVYHAMRILVVKPSALGDIVQAFPALAYLRQKFPTAQIDWLVKPANASLVKAHPDIDTVFTTDSLPSERYDIAFDLQGNMKSAWMLMRIKARTKAGFGLKSLPEWPNFFATDLRFNPPKGRNIREDYLFIVQSPFEAPFPFQIGAIPLKLTCEESTRLLSLNPPEGSILICPSATWPNKRLPESDFVEYLSQFDAPTLYFSWGSTEEEGMAHALAAHFPHKAVVLDRLTIPLLQHFMDAVSLVVAMDSFPLHLCGTTETPSVSFFGPSSAHKYAPEGSQTYQGTCPYGVTFEKRCPRLRTCSTGACMKNMHLKKPQNHETPG